MEEIIKAFLGMFSIAILVCIGIGLIDASITAYEAQNFVMIASAEIENSNYADGIIKKVKDDASKKGYVLDVSKSGSEQDTWGMATLEYPFSLPILNVDIKKQTSCLLN